MSQKLNNQLKKDTYKITDAEMLYLKKLDGVKHLIMQYQDALTTDYLHDIAIRLGYKQEDTLEFQLDLKADTKELKITVVKE